MPNTHITFIGAGNMAQALVGGLLAKDWPANALTLTDINTDALESLGANTGVNITNDNKQAVANADVVVLAVKPQVLKHVCSDLVGALANQPMVISIAAGITTAQLTQWLSYSKIVRVMPNTPSLVQAGAAGLFAAESVSDDEKALADTILQAAGICRWFNDESQLDAVTAVSGSGPAYFFSLMEAMIAAAKNLGLDQEDASQLVLQTALGAAKLAQQSHDSPATLRRNVTSPGGTTAAALAVFEQADFGALVETAIIAAKQRSVELSAD